MQASAKRPKIATVSTLLRPCPSANPGGLFFVCRRDGDRVRVFSRNGRDWTDRVPLIAEALAALARNTPFDFKEGRETL